MIETCVGDFGGSICVSDDDEVVSAATVPSVAMSPGVSPGAADVPCAEAIVKAVAVWLEDKTAASVGGRSVPADGEADPTQRNNQSSETKMIQMDKKAQITP